MSDSSLHTTLLRRWLERIRAGDLSARDELLRATDDRLERLARKMLRRYPAVKRWEETGDLLHNAVLRLLRALRDVDPTSVRDFFGLAAEQMRRELLDMARHHHTRRMQVLRCAADAEGSHSGAAAYRQAITLREQLASHFPHVPKYREELAMSYSNFGNLLHDREQFQVALDWYGKAIPLLETIRAQNVRLASVRQSLRNAHWGRAEVLSKLGSHAESAKDWLRAAELDDGWTWLHFHTQYAAELARAGEHQVAVKTAEELLGSAAGKSKSTSPGQPFYNAAFVYAVSAAAVKGDAPLNQQYTARAVALLRQAQAAGFFNEPKKIENFKKDSDFESLRRRDDFQKFARELAEPRKPH